MALTPQEEQELTQLEKELAGSVMLGDRPQPSMAQQFGQAVKENLPALGGMVGGVLGAVGTRTPMGAEAGAALGSTAIRSMIGAGLGGATGEAARQGLEGISPSARSALAIARGGVEQAIYDGLGNLIISYGGKAYQIGKDALAKQFAGKPPEDAIVAAQKLLQEGGGSLTKFQATGNIWEGFKESVSRGSFTGKPVFEKAEERNISALMKAKNNILDETSTRIYDSLQTGKEFTEAIKEGDAALKSLTRPFYEALDKAPSVAQAPVQISAIKDDATKVLENASKMGGLTLSAKEKQYLEAVNLLPSNIGFSAAHDLASSLKTTLRDLERASEPDSKTVFRLKKLVSTLEKQMDEAGSKFQGTAIPFEGRFAEETSNDLAKQYRFYSNFYRDSIKDLYSDTTAKLLNKDPEFVGKTIFQNGNVTAWNEAKSALGRAKKLSPELNVKQTMESVQRGYLENLLKSEDSFAKLGDKLQNDEAMRRTFENVLPKEVQQRVRTLLEAARLSEKQPGATAPLFLAAQQAQTISALGSVAALTLSDEARNAAADNPIKTVLVGGVILLGPRFWAKAATSPEATNAALAIAKSQKDGTPISKNLFLKASGAFEKAGITAQDLTGETQQQTQPVGLTDAEKEELQKLEAEIGR